jgi:hypothetical protein
MSPSGVVVLPFSYPHGDFASYQSRIYVEAQHSTPHTASSTTLTNFVVYKTFFRAVLLNFNYTCLSNTNASWYGACFRF